MEFIKSFEEGKIFLFRFPKKLKFTKSLKLTYKNHDCSSYIFRTTYDELSKTIMVESEYKMIETSFTLNKNEDYRVIINSKKTKIYSIDHLMFLYRTHKINSGVIENRYSCNFNITEINENIIISCLHTSCIYVNIENKDGERVPKTSQKIKPILTKYKNCNGTLVNCLIFMFVVTLFGMFLLIKLF